jgi:PAS domain-containing protein
MLGGGGVGNPVHRAVRFRFPAVVQYAVVRILRPLLTVHDHVVHQPGGKERFVPARPTPRLQAFPAEDLAFRRFVAEAHAGLLAEVDARPEMLLEPEELQVRLRARYPAAVVRPRDRLADPGDGDVVWYVYRFGSVSPGLRWWEEPGHAWAILDDDRRFVEVSTSLTEIVETPRQRLLGQLVDSLANPEDASALDDVQALWVEFIDRGELHSSLRFRRLDGSPRELEYHVTKDGAGPERHLAVVREVEVA